MNQKPPWKTRNLHGLRLVIGLRAAKEIRTGETRRGIRPLPVSGCGSEGHQATTGPINIRPVFRPFRSQPLSQ